MSTTTSTSSVIRRGGAAGSVIRNPAASPPKNMTSFRSSPRARATISTASPPTVLISTGVFQQEDRLRFSCPAPGQHEERPPVPSIRRAFHRVVPRRPQTDRVARILHRELVLPGAATRVERPERLPAKVQLRL